MQINIIKCQRRPNMYDIVFYQVAQMRDQTVWYDCDKNRVLLNPRLRQQLDFLVYRLVDRSNSLGSVGELDEDNEEDSLSKPMLVEPLSIVEFSQDISDIEEVVEVLRCICDALIKSFDVEEG